MDVKEINKEIRKLPQKTGVYLFKGETVLYVGKAASIRERVLNHLQASKTNIRESQIIGKTTQIDYIVTPTEVDALIEENILIKLHKPRYNIRLGDDKTYPYLKLSNEDYPSISIVRQMKDDEGKYFGPYADVGAMRKSLKTLRRLFPVRNCRKDFSKKQVKKCLYYHIGLCSGPCEGKITKQEYRDLVKALSLVLEGRSEKLLSDLNQRMLEAAGKMEYEIAARCRDQIDALKKTTAEVPIIASGREDFDVLAIARSQPESCIQLLQIKEGKLISSESFDLSTTPDDSDFLVLESFIKQYYAKRVFIPSYLVVSKRLADASTIVSWLSKRKGSTVEIKQPRRGPQYQLLKLAYENATTHIDEKTSHQQRIEGGMRLLQETLQLPSHPQMIECYDVSTLQGKSSVGSLVVFKKGIPYKKGYRRFKIRSIVGQDDPAMIGEIVYRRFKRHLEDKTSLPDLVIVDGGLTQMRSAQRSLRNLGVEIAIIGLAKEYENIYTINHNSPLNLPSDSDALYLLQRIRNEAHRFAISYHRKLREKIM